MSLGKLVTVVILTRKPTLPSVSVSGGSSQLELKDNYQISPVDTRGIDFVGYRHFRTYILLRKTTSKNMIRKMRKLLKKSKNGRELTYSEWCSINSYKGWMKWANCYNLYKKWIEPLEPYCEQYYKKNIKGKKNKQDFKK